MNRRLIAAGCAVAWWALPALAQTTLTLDANGQWQKSTPADADNPDAKTMAAARQLIAERRPSDAYELLGDWIKAGDRKANAYAPEAYLLRGRAKLDDDEETNALREWEVVVKKYPASEQFVPALEGEFEVAKLYIAGLRPRAIGIRIDDGKPVVEEIILRINERLPGSKLAEKALISLADMYYRDRDLPIAVETYDVFLRLYPRSQFRSRALQRRAFATIAQFRGPGHDPSGLVEARYQIEDFQREFPAEADRLGMSDALIARLDDSGAAHLLKVAKWYQGRGDQPSARYTLGRLITKHPGSSAAVEAIDILEQEGWPLPGSTHHTNRSAPESPSTPPVNAAPEAAEPVTGNAPAEKQP